GITIDVLDACDRADCIVLASGDGDFDLLLERVRSRGLDAGAAGPARPPQPVRRQQDLADPLHPVRAAHPR
ncbi:NYN domain-containing protein, partial [Metapseudomonas otitidis]|uniref:NYN domain-containing protein n=1 Tax=Metapseudomonas otitidis TaxID=319939 RepID=UPI00374CA76E